MQNQCALWAIVIRMDRSVDGNIAGRRCIGFAGGANKNIRVSA